jgi:hypothetical protein
VLRHRLLLRRLELLRLDRHLLSAELQLLRARHLLPERNQLLPRHLLLRLQPGVHGAGLLHAVVAAAAVHRS